MPPAALTVALPVLLPRQSTLVCVPTTALKALDGCVIVTVALAVQPFASVTTTVYVPAASAVAVASPCPLLQAKVYGAVPPAADAVAPPVDWPKMPTLVWAVIAAVSGVAGWLMVTVPVTEQPLASVIVQE